MHAIQHEFGQSSPHARYAIAQRASLPDAAKDVPRDFVEARKPLKLVSLLTVRSGVPPSFDSETAVNGCCSN